MRVEEFCARVVQPLPLPDRLRLATISNMVLSNIPPDALVDYSEEWSEEDLRDVTLASLRHAVTSFGEEEYG
ncbi:MAG: hypothetical protein MAG451_01850 [Anaerolineales bacterium]|nr:hypothetical protein [Anaerolineales bacterium]